MIRKTIFIVVAFLGLSACESPYVSYPQAERLANTPSEGVAYLADTTYAAFNRYHGNQYEYLGPDGTLALIYPGNRVPVRGFWKVKGAGEFDAKMCFLYGPRSYNPVTREFGGRWECRSLISFLYDMEEAYDGDVFGVHRMRRLPSPIAEGRPQVTITQALANWGRSAPRTPNKALSKEHRR